MIRELARKDNYNIPVCSGDIIKIISTKGGDSLILVEVPITKSQVISSVMIAEIENELGFQSGIVGVMGVKSN